LGQFETKNGGGKMEDETKRGPLVLLGGVAAAAAAGFLLSLVMMSAAVPTAGPEAVAAAAWQGEEKELIPLGRAVGIKLFSDGVLVVGLSAVETENGRTEPGRESGLKAGDIIVSIGGQEVNTIERVQEIVAQQEGQPLTLQVSRGEKSLQMSTTAVKNSQGKYQLGIWLRDSMAGIGTLTFYDPATGSFAALGHGINDVDTALLMPMEEGGIMYASVSDVKKGERGSPGELHGIFDVSRELGTLYANTPLGVFGQLSDTELLGDAQPIPMARREEVHEGAATILSNVEGDAVQEYAVEILQIYPATEGETRNLMVEVRDEQLLDLTGGIVQGMSGSPILQDGKLVGAVTHVLINDPTCGYGILAENMITQVEGVPEQALVS